MSDKTKIEWTHATWNPVRGCSLASDGCKNCYAMAVAGRFCGPGQPYERFAHMTSQGAKWTGVIAVVPHMLTQPLKWKRPRRIFVNSMSDLFHEAVPDDFIDKVFAVMALAPHHTFQILTKRPERMRAYLTRGDRDEAIGWAESAIYEEVGRLPAGAYQGPAHRRLPLPNVEIGVSVENQSTADKRIPELDATPAAVRFISAEPLLGPVTIDFGWLWGTGSRNGIDWVIVGGESGPRARPMHPDWARSLRDQCVAAGVPFLFKQWGEWAPAHESMCLPIEKWQEFKEGETTPRNVRFIGEDAAQRCQLMGRIGKEAAGRLLDGVLHDGYPGGAA